MEFSEEHKNKIEKMVVEEMISSLEKNELKEEELSAIAEFILGKIDNIKTQEELIVFLGELSSKWLIFKNIEELEKGEVKEQQEKIVAKDVLQLAKDGKIEDAIDLAKTVTENS